ncbi:MAG: hypothetical protein M1546_05050 [Chloroflexi bacterium]|nr:hypothetical protein [Chloroflexota bacterium]
MEVTNDVLCAGATLFDVDRATLRHLGGMDGAVYEYQSGCAAAADSGARILKFTPIAAEQLPTVRAKFDFVNYLGARGVGVAKPILSIHGELVEPLDAGEVFYAVTSAEKAPGQLAKNSREWGPALFEKWGQVIGQMHRLTKDYDSFRTWPAA